MPRLQHSEPKKKKGFIRGKTKFADIQNKKQANRATKIGNIRSEIKTLKKMKQALMIKQKSTNKIENISTHIKQWEEMKRDLILKQKSTKSKGPK